MIKVLLVEDHELVRMGLTLMLEQTEDITLIAQAEDGLKGVELANELMPDVIIMDIGLPLLNGIEATKRIKLNNPNCKILMCTSSDENDDILDSFKSGADGYIMKGAPKEQMFNAIRTVNEGAAWIDPAVAKFVLSGLRDTHTSGDYNKISQNSDINYEAGKKLYGLTEREMQVLALLVEGLTNIQISKKLCISSATAKTHVHSILQKLSAETRAKATKTALTEGLI